VNLKNYRFVFLLGLFLLPLYGCGHTETPPHSDDPLLAGTPRFTEPPLITGITIDEELAQLLEQVVPYDGPLPENQRFLYNLNKLINEDLKEQDEKYKLAAAKLALRMALAINKTVDSIEVRRSLVRSRDSWLKYGVCVDVDGNFFSWGLGCENRDGLQFLNNATVYELFMIEEEKRHIVKVGVSVFENSCAGIFDSCCGGLEYPRDIDDAWYQHFIDLGREVDFPFSDLKNIRSYQVTGNN